jgi:pimeloyl-ACP methyl ester carboxylesterase
LHGLGDSLASWVRVALPKGSLEFFRGACPARFTPLPRAGHLPHLELPKELAQALLR